MIHGIARTQEVQRSKPRASGDDPLAEAAGNLNAV